MHSLSSRARARLVLGGCVCVCVEKGEEYWGVCVCVGEGEEYGGYVCCVCVGEREEAQPQNRGPTFPLPT